MIILPKTAFVKHFCNFRTVFFKHKLWYIYSDVKKRFLFGCQSKMHKNSSASMSSVRTHDKMSKRYNSPLVGSPKYLDGLSSVVLKEIQETMFVLEDFLSDEEESSLMLEIQPYIKRLRYEFDHWDNAIHGYRETEKLNWNTSNDAIIKRVRDIAFPPGVAQLQYVHVLDLSEDGVIKPHVDSVRFCGDTIAGLSLLSDSVMRLAREKDPSLYADILLPRKSLYIMKGTARFDYTHAILGNEESFFKGSPVLKTRRVSVICRNEPASENPPDT